MSLVSLSDAQDRAGDGVTQDIIDEVEDAWTAVIGPLIGERTETFFLSNRRYGWMAASGALSLVPMKSAVICCRLIVIRFDCRTAWRITDRPTPTRTANCSGMSMVRAKVTDSTAFCTRPVFQTDSNVSGLMVRNPIRVSRPARAGMAT